MKVWAREISRSSGWRRWVIWRSCIRDLFASVQFNLRSVFRYFWLVFRLSRWCCEIATTTIACYCKINDCPDWTELREQTPRSHHLHYCHSWFESKCLLCTTSFILPFRLPSCWSCQKGLSFSVCYKYFQITVPRLYSTCRSKTMWSRVSSTLYVVLSFLPFITRLLRLWETLIIFPIPKHGSSSSVNNCHSIDLACMLPEVFETVSANQFRPSLKRNRLLEDSHYDIGLRSFANLHFLSAYFWSRWSSQWLELGAKAYCWKCFGSGPIWLSYCGCHALSPSKSFSHEFMVSYLHRFWILVSFKVTYLHPPSFLCFLIIFSRQPITRFNVLLMLSFFMLLFYSVPIHSMGSVWSPRLSVNSSPYWSPFVSKFALRASRETAFWRSPASPFTKLTIARHLNIALFWSLSTNGRSVNRWLLSKPYSVRKFPLPCGCLVAFSIIIILVPVLQNSLS